MMFGGGYGLVSGDMLIRTDGRVVKQGSTGGNKKKELAKIDRKHMISQWSTNEWRPVNGLLFHDGFVYFKRENRVMCCNADSGEMEWMGLENAYQPPADAARMMTYTW